MTRDQNDEALVDLGRYIRAQRELAKVSLRHFARMVNVSDSYLSQLERGKYSRLARCCEPSPKASALPRRAVPQDRLAARLGSRRTGRRIGGDRSR